MTLREIDDDGYAGGVIPEVPELLVVVASADDARELAALGRGGHDASGEPVRPVLVATGPEPLEVDAVLDELAAPAGRLLILDGPCESWVEEAARLVVRLDALVTEAPPAGVVVRGGSEAALAATRSAVRNRVPVLHLAADGLAGPEAATQAAVAELAAWQTSPAGGLPYPTEIDLLVHRRLAPPPARTRPTDPTVVRMPPSRGSRSSMTA